MGRKELLRRYSTFILSVFIIAFGLSAVVRSDLGTSPISSTPYVFSINTPPTIGTYLFILCLLFIVVQMILMTKKQILESKFELLVQIPISFIFGMCTDLTMWILSDLHPQMYSSKVITLVIGCFVLALGICLEVVANVAMMGGEYTVQIASKRFKKEFGTVKIIFDVTLITLAIVSSILFSSKIEGIREGTIIAALITGPFVRIIMPRLAFVRRWQEVENISETPNTSSLENQPILITISREYGSGGHEIGEQLAKQLNIPFYDRNLIEMVAREGDFSSEFVSKNEQNIINSPLYNMILQDYEAPLEKSLSPEDALFVAQSKVINRIASEGSCVIVGRCSNFILSRFSKNINLFIHADINHKSERIISRYGVDKTIAKAEIERIDKARADHYRHYTGKIWGDARNYHLCFNSGLLSIDEICNTVEGIYKKGIN